MAQRQPVRRQFLLLHQAFERGDDRIVRRQIKNGVAELARTLPGEIGLCRIDLDRLEQQHVGVEPQAGALRHQAHAEEVAELQDCPVAPGAVRLRRAQPFGENVRQDRFGFGVADAIGQTGKRIEAVDGDVVSRRDLRSQAGLPETIERAMPEGDDVRTHARHL